MTDTVDIIVTDDMKTSSDADAEGLIVGEVISAGKVKYNYS